MTRIRYYRWNWRALSRACFLPLVIAALTAGLILRMLPGFESREDTFAAVLLGVLVVTELCILILSARVGVDVTQNVIIVRNPIRSTVIPRNMIDHIEPNSVPLWPEPVVKVVYRQPDGKAAGVSVLAVPVRHLDRLLDILT